MRQAILTSLLACVIATYGVSAHAESAQMQSDKGQPRPDFPRGLAVQAFLRTPGGAALEPRGAAHLSADIRSTFVSGEMPVYPSRDTGAGVFRVVLDASGRVTRVKTVRTTSHGLLDNAAIKALRTWRAKPGQARVIDIPVTFQIPGRHGGRWDGPTGGYPNLPPRPAPGNR